MPRRLKLAAKRASRANPRQTRNIPENVLNFVRSRETDELRPASKRVTILPKSVAQETYLDALEAPHNSIVIATGPAGTGKTYIATLFAIQSFLAGKCKKIIITRPVVTVDEQIGFLPGPMLSKMEPWIAPIIDVFKEYFSVQDVENMLRKEQIQVIPLSFVRGRTFKNAIIICDEMQNALPSHMMATLTRIGENSQMILTGDLQQTDRGATKNGLFDFIERLAKKGGSDKIAVCRFTALDIERHPVIEEVLRMYND